MTELPILVTTHDLATLLHVAPGTVRRWASEDQWTAYGTRRQRLWDFNEAQESADRRYPA